MRFSTPKGDHKPADNDALTLIRTTVPPPDKVLVPSVNGTPMRRSALLLALVSTATLSPAARMPSVCGARVLPLALLLVTSTPSTTRTRLLVVVPKLARHPLVFGTITAARPLV